MAARGFLGGGDIYIDRVDPATGQKTGRKGPFETEKFAVTPKAEIKEMKSKGRATYGQVIESVPIPQPTELAVDLKEIDAEGLTLALMGETDVINTGSGTIKDEALTAKLGTWVRLSKQNLAETGFTLAPKASGAPFRLGKDYLIHYRLGMFMALAGGAIADGAELVANGTYLATSGTLIRGSRQPQLRAELVLDGVNFADNRPVIVTVHEAILTPSGEFDFLKDDFGNIQLSGRLKTPAGMTEPYTVQYLDI